MNVFCSWFSLLEGSRWFQLVSGLMRAAVTVAAALEREARPVLVHCSDGWDRTPQIVALSQLLLDPHYRTIEVTFLASCLTTNASHTRETYQTEFNC
jgi:protein tyrosine/serine phosphatase